MYKLIKLTKNVCKLGDLVLNQNTPKINSVYNKNINFYCSQAQKELPCQIPGLSEDINIQNLTKNDPDLLKKLQLIILEIDVMRQEGSRVPESTFIKEQHWQELILKTTRSQRKRYLEFLWKVEKKKENQAIKREQARIERENRPEYEDDGHIRYGLNHNTYFIRIYDSTMNNLYNSKLIQAMQFGQPLVIDCGYDNNMTKRECLNCAKQIMLAFSDNRNNKDPFDLHLCNANKTSYTMESLHRFIATLYEQWFPLHVHSESYLSTQFPSLPPRTPPQLVYLTPHCREEMREFDHNAVYIIGGIVDKINQEPLSLARAKQDKIQMRRLPLDRYLHWGSGSGKSLTINQMVAILLDLKNSGDWDYALRHVPRRKVIEQPLISENKWQNKRNSKLVQNRSFDKLKPNTNLTTNDLIKQLLKN